MSNFLAIATVTAALGQMLQAAIGTDVPGSTVTTVRPEGPQSGTPTTGVNAYLFQVTPNAAWRNLDIPTRRTDGQLVQRPAIALDLHYLLTFYGNEAQLEPQRLLGSVVRTLHTRPVLTRQAIRDTLASPTYAFLAQSDLADAVELVKFTPSALSLEELAKLWSVFYQIPYVLSIAYLGTVVIIESEVSTQPALPIRSRVVVGSVFRQPVIESVVANGGADGPIVMGSVLQIQGMNLGAVGTSVRLAGVDVTPSELSDTRLQLPLAAPPFPPNVLRSGIQGLQVIQPTLLGLPPIAHSGVESNVAPIVLRPTITSVSVANVSGTGAAPRSADLAIQVSPTIGASQRVVLLLNERTNVSPSAYSFVGPGRATDSASIVFSVTGIKAGDYLVRLQIDGAESPLVVDTNQNSPTFNQYVGPAVTIP
ncbi:MAG TPA: DUF4255 domain-containing protein [Chloroflexota bacterium]|nr:DUF4255 domain-containing protein [Chloroflexota bacterium]